MINKDIKNWNEKDLEIVKLGYQIDSVSEIAELCKNNDLVRVADTNDFKYAYGDYLKDNQEILSISYENFLKEINKGYGESGVVDIARLMLLSTGIYYDNCYC